ncbi:MAG TPA: hypothetical protein VJR02_11030 [Pyrinomonadaceae bacterium]|nr:hypothetical protein [Pyrinomonadaceae bacterium]
MSSLIFHTDESQVFTATDTLATTPDGEPFSFTTKVFVVPHLRMLMAGTGVGGVLGKWFIAVHDRMIVRGIDNLDYHTPRILSEIWQSHRQECSIPEDFTTTIYHLGFSEETGLVHSYAYRSAENFRSESLSYGMRLKPECEIPEPYSFPMDIKKMMDSQRAIQAKRPKEERIYIGGEIMIHHLTDQSFTVYVLDEFEDYEANERAIFSNFDKR